MANLFIPDRYFEKRLEDGTIVSIRTKYIVEALLYYKNQCYKVIEDSNKIITSAPKILVAESFEDAIKKINKITDAHKKVDEAENLIHIIDDILLKMSIINPPKNQNTSENDQNQPSAN